MNKGSQWRKWDLHVHTPLSILNNGFGNDWDNYVKELFTRALQNKISVIGITDYFILDGYKKIRKDYLEKPKKMMELFTEEEIVQINKILVLPNIEFRLNKLVGTNRINYHVLFSNNVSIEEIEENFLHELDFIYEGNPQGIDESLKLKIFNLEKLGKKLKIDHEKFRDKSDLEIGMMNAVVDDSRITELLVGKPSIFSDNYFILLPCDEDLSKLSWNGQDHQTRKVLIQKSDILIATNPNTIKWGLGQFNDSKEEFVSEFKSLKPCIGGSDSHSYDEMFVKNKDRATWIKADVSFEGLRQIIFEPEHRVKLSGDEPYIKDSKNVIDKVKIISPDKTFTDSELCFNDNLNVIIGGKSSGKSILLYNIARTLFQDNKENSLLKTYNPDSKKEDYKYDFGQNFDFIVRLKSKVTQSINKEMDEPSILPNIKYIPQNYLSELAERKFKRSNELNKLVRELILEDSVSNSEYSTFLNNVKHHDKLRESLINNYFDIVNEVKGLKERLISAGNRDALEKSITNNQLVLGELKVEAGFNEDENRIFDELKESDKRLKLNYDNVIEDWRKTKSFNTELLNSVQELVSRKELYINSLSDVDIQNYYRGKFNQLDALKNVLLEMDRDTMLNDKGHFINKNIFGDKLIELNAGLEKNKLSLEPFNLKIEISNKIDFINKSQLEDEKKLNEILNIEKEIKLKEAAKEVQFEKIFELYKATYEEYISIISKLENRINKLEDENLHIKGIVKFNFNRFKENFIELSNSTSKSYDGYDILKYDNATLVDIDKMVTEKKDIFNRLAKNEYVLKKNFSSQQAAKELLNDRFFDYWEVSSNNDTLYKMSTGKASFIILKLIIGLSKSNSPILIDQPEDNLDNRSITKELVDYLKVKKLERQIILVTHNPNIVVNADAENIIIAHQYGQNAREVKFDFRFDYVNGSLENSFPKVDSDNILLSMGIREHIADIVEGGKDAFKQRELKYRFR